MALYWNHLQVSLNTCSTPTCTAKKKECERAVLKAAKYTKKKNLVLRGDDIFDTRTHNLADVSSFSPCAINLLLRMVESGSALATNLTSRARSSNSQLVRHKICSHFATSWDSWGFVHLVKPSWSSPHETFHVATNATLNPDEKTTGATIGYNVCVANNNLRYNLRLPWRKKKKKKRNSS